MKLLFVLSAVVCLVDVPSVLAQNNRLFSAPAVSFYQLGHKAPKEARRLFEKGSSELKQRHYELSLKSFQEALDVDPRYWAAELNLGCTYLLLYDQERAIQAFKRALEIDPQNPIGYANLSIVALSRKDYRLAEDSARTAMRLNPLMSEAKALVGLAQVGRGYWSPEAHKLLKESRGCFPGSERVLANWPSDDEVGPKVVVNSASTLPGPAAPVQ